MLVTIRLTLPFTTFGTFAESSVPTVPFIGVSMSGLLSSYWPLVPTVSVKGLSSKSGGTSKRGTRIFSVPVT